MVATGHVCQLCTGSIEVGDRVVEVHTLTEAGAMANWGAAFTHLACATAQPVKSAAPAFSMFLRARVAENALERTVRGIVRDELRREREARQAECKHLVSATIQEAGGDLVCDECGKTLDLEEDDHAPPDEPVVFKPNPRRK